MGRWQREQRVCRETLGWFGLELGSAAWFMTQLGIIASDQGNSDDAAQWYESALTIDETASADRRRGSAQLPTSNLGSVAQ